MKRYIISILAAICMLTITVYGVATDYSVTGNYTDNVSLGTVSVKSNNGLVDGYETAVLSPVIYDNNNCLQIIPNTSYAQSKPVMIDHYSVVNLGMDLANLKYIRFYVYYDGETAIKPMINLMPQNKANLLKLCTVYASNELVPNCWQWITFDISTAVYGHVNTGGVLSQFHFYPYGNTAVQNLENTDVMYISTVKYVSQNNASAENGEGVNLYPIYFERGIADVSGTEPAPVLYAVGDTVTLPENIYFTREHYSFTGWICSADGNLYQPGDIYTLVERTRIPSNVTAEVTFIPNWEYITEISDNFSDYYCANASVIQDSAVVTKNYEFDGKSTLKVTVNNESDNYITLDGWIWDTLPFDLDFYRYAEISYYYESSNPVSFSPAFRLLTNGGALSENVFISADSSSVSGKWATFGFDLLALKDKLSESSNSHILKQMHLRIGGNTATDNGVKASDFSSGDNIYISEITLYNENPNPSEVLRADYSTYYNHNNDIVKDSATVTKNFEFDSKNTLKIEINNTSENYVVLDGWSWANLPFDLDYFKYATIEYYYDSNNPVSFSPNMVLLTNGGALTSSVHVVSDNSAIHGKWGLLGFDISQASSKLSLTTDSHILKQFHMRLGGNTTSTNGIKASGFSDGDIIYFSEITLYHEKPESVPVIVNSLIDSDGIAFSPDEPVTRAEAADMIYRAVMRTEETLPVNPSCTYSDVPVNHEFYNSIACLYTLGILPEASIFNPDSNITISEFAHFIQNAQIGSRTSTLLANTSKQTVTREEAVVILSEVTEKSVPTDISGIDTPIFTDIDSSFESYAEILDAVIPRISTFDEYGNETVIEILYNLEEAEILVHAATEGTQYLESLDAVEEQRITEIRNTESEYTIRNGVTVYYISSTDGTTSSAGTSENLPRLISNLSEVTATNLGINPGDVVLFKRGDVFRGQLTTVSGVTYSAYGTGTKPEFRRSPQNYTGSENWTLYYSDDTTGKKIWKYNDTITNDVGAIIINNGEKVGIKEIPNYNTGVYYVRGSGNSQEFNLVTDLDRNLEYFHYLEHTSTSSPTPSSSGYLYFRCDEGNPGTLYESIEMNLYGNAIRAYSNVTIDNICIKYFGSHGIGAGSVTNLTVTNCEIGYGGGAIQYYNASTSSNPGSVVRYGNGVEIYGGVVNFLVDNCYVYQIYDAGVTHQYSKTSAGNCYMENVVYSNNLLCDSTYNIEYFMSSYDSVVQERYMTDILFENNIIRRAGYGWGQQRPDHAPANIKGWTHANLANNFIIRENVIDRTFNVSGGSDYLVQLGATYKGNTPHIENNIFIQRFGGDFAYIVKSADSFKSSNILIDLEYGNDMMFIIE